jgi:NADPH:quinone reductase-like Zn-dependent oxidoreductase
MKAIRQDSFGSTDVLEVANIDRPEIGSDDVLVRVQAAGVDASVWHFMRGLPYLFRIAGAGLRAPTNPVRGGDLAGLVEAIGNDVTQFEEGDEVFGVGDGAFAEYARARADQVASMPPSLTVEQAAAVPTSACTALQGLRDQARVEPGQSVLVIGAGGGVGSFAVQIARAFGARVTGVCSTAKVELVRSIGADEVIDYTKDDFVRMGRSYDAILDIAGNRPLSDLRSVLTRRGTLVIVGGEGGGRWFGGLERQVHALVISPFVRHRLRMYVSRASAEDLQALTGLIEDGEVMPIIDRTYPLPETPEAIRYVEEGNARGKVVITL